MWHLQNLREKSELLARFTILEKENYPKSQKVQIFSVNFQNLIILEVFPKKLIIDRFS